MGHRFFACLAMGLLLAACGTMEAAPVTVENFSFEQPAEGKIKGWNGEGVAGTPAVDIPGWASDAAPADSGIETGWGATDGEYTGFLMGGDPSTYNLTSYTIAANDVFELLIDAKNGNLLQMDLYYDDGGNRAQAATTTYATVTGGSSDPLETYSLVFSANDVPDSIGKQIGIELVNGSGWMQFDNVRLDVTQIPEPATLSLTGSGLLVLLFCGWRSRTALTD